MPLPSLSPPVARSASSPVTSTGRSADGDAGQRSLCASRASGWP